MAQQLRDAFEVIRSLREALHVDEEMAKLQKIDSTLDNAEKRRNKRAEQEIEEIKELQQQLSLIKKATTRDQLNWRSKREHDKEVHKLQSQRFDMAKRQNEIEDELGILDREVKELQRELEEIGAAEVESEVSEDFDSITLALFRKLGFVPTYSREASAPAVDGDAASPPQLVSILTRSDTRNRATEVEVQTERCRQLGITPFALADQLWRAVE